MTSDLNNRVVEGPLDLRVRPGQLVVDGFRSPVWVRGLARSVAKAGPPLAECLEDGTMPGLILNRLGGQGWRDSPVLQEDPVARIPLLVGAELAVGLARASIKPGAVQFTDVDLFGSLAFR